MADEQRCLFDGNKADGFRMVAVPAGYCYWCPAKFRIHAGQNDHLWPQSRGGAITVRACDGCNHKKSDADPQAWVSQRKTWLLSQIDGELLIGEDEYTLCHIWHKTLQSERDSVRERLVEMIKTSAESCRDLWDAWLWLDRFSEPDEAGSINFLEIERVPLQQISEHQMPQQVYRHFAVVRFGEMLYQRWGNVGFCANHLVRKLIGRDIFAMDDGSDARTWLYSITVADYAESLAASANKYRGLSLAEPIQKYKDRYEDATRSAELAVKHRGRRLDPRILHQKIVGNELVTD